MNELKRYDQELARQLAHLPLPDENFAWAEMEKMMDEDGDDPAIIPFYRRFGCLLSGLIGLLMLSVGGWYFYQKNKKEEIPVSINSPVSNRSVNNRNADSAKLTAVNKLVVNDSMISSTIPSGSDSIQVVPGNSMQQNEILSDAKVVRATFNDNTTMKVNRPATTEDTDEAYSKRKNNNRATKGKIRVNVVPTIATDEFTAKGSDEKNDDSSTYTNAEKITAIVQHPTVDSANIQQQKKDSSLVVKQDTAINKKNTETVPDKEKEPKKKSWMLAAGLTVYQPFPLNGESAVPYNRYGRKGSLADYIPSASLRLYRNKKWFLHTEFRYGAPQAVKPFNYKQDVSVDSFQTITRSVFQLKKTFYHQVAFSFHYNVLPGLSVGTGIIYNRFSGAVANQDIFRSNNTPVGDTLISSAVVSDPDKNRFVKNHFQWSAAAQYQWKRISIGARYSKDIDPYIKFNDINTGLLLEKKAEAFNIFIRYELWRKKL